VKSSGSGTWQSHYYKRTLYRTIEALWVLLPTLYSREAGNEYSDKRVDYKFTPARFEAGAIIIECIEETSQPRHVLRCITEIVKASGGLGRGIMKVGFGALKT
jgi:hypothetical protein